MPQKHEALIGTYKSLACNAQAVEMFSQVTVNQEEEVCVDHLISERKDPFLCGKFF